MSCIQIIGVIGIPLIKAGDDIAKIVCEATNNQGVPIQNNDIIVITHKIVSKAECRIVNLSEVKPSPFALKIAKKVRKSPELVELILRESKSIVKLTNGHLITETHHGWICANSGVDVSNISGGNSVSLLPENPDRSAKQIRLKIEKITGKKVAVIISDTSGRPLRRGHIDVAIGVSGLDPLLNLRGGKDLFGYTLKVKETAVADELASAAELVIGQAQERIPVAIIRGYKYLYSETAGAKKLIRPRKEELFL